MGRSMNLTFEIDDAVVYALAVSQGWSPTVEDTTQELVEDNHPLIPNPVTIQMFMAQAIPAFITSTVVTAGRTKVLTDFSSIYDGLEHSVKKGDFDAMILAGDIDGIKAAVKANL